MKKYTLALIFLMVLNACGSSSRAGGNVTQSINAESQQESRPVKTLRDYPDFLEFDIVGVNDDGSMVISVTGFEFFDEKTLGEKVLLKYGAPSEINILDIIRYHGDDYVLLDYDGKKYLTFKKS
jgi:hypothetical protein